MQLSRSCKKVKLFLNSFFPGRVDVCVDCLNTPPLLCLDNLPQDIVNEDLDTYEALVRHHVELFYSSAKRYVQESALSQRVRDWQDTIDPFLSEQVGKLHCVIRRKSLTFTMSKEKSSNYYLNVCVVNACALCESGL